MMIYSKREIQKMKRPSLLKKVTIKGPAYCKINILGYSGGGKTFTACQLAIGLCKDIGLNDVAFFDSEGGTDYMIRRFEKHNINLHVCKSRSFYDKVNVMKECIESGIKVLIIDSVSHTWQDLTEGFEKRRNRKNGLVISDWKIIKKTWRQEFVELYLNSPMHIIALGRASNDMDTDTDEAGKMQIKKVGTKMKSEGEFPYESSLLLEMESVKAKMSVKDKNQVIKCTVLKDRTDNYNGDIIYNPRYSSFIKFFEFHDFSGQQTIIDVAQKSDAFFTSDDTPDSPRKKILLEEIDGELARRGLSGTSRQAKQDRSNLLNDTFGTSSWTAIKRMSIDDIEANLDELKRTV